MRWKGEGFGHAGRYRTGSRVGKEERRRLSSSSSEIAISRFWIAISKREVREVVKVSQRADGGGGRAICKIRASISEGEVRKMLMVSQRV